MPDTMIAATGGCLCGKVRYRAARVSPEVSECHCGQCRRQSGHRYATVRADTDGLEIEGEDNITWFSRSADARDGFCSTCGSHLVWRGDGPDHVSLLAGSLDQPNRLAMARHIFVDDKAGYYEIDDGLPCYAGYDRPL